METSPRFNKVYCPRCDTFSLFIRRTTTPYGMFESAVMEDTITLRCCGLERQTNEVRKEIKQGLETMKNLLMAWRIWREVQGENKAKEILALLEADLKNG